MEFKSESIIVSAVRTFCKSFAGILGILIGVLLVVFIMAMFSSPDIYPPKSSLTIAPDANGNRDMLPQTAPVVLKLNITGVVGQGNLVTEKIQNCLLDSREGLLAPNRVKALLLFINTPGGTANDADGIYRALLSYKKKYQIPIYAYVEGMCASGGMYIACAADRIFASSNSVIGSVGVILGPTFNFSGLMDRYGVQSLTITEGKDKDMLNPFRPWQPGEDISLRNFINATYHQFVDIVASSRPQLSREKLVNEYGAQIYVAEKAQALGYIDDGNSNYESALTELASNAKLPTDHYQVMTIEPEHSIFEDFMQGSVLSGKLTHRFQIGSIDSEFSGRILYLYQPGLQ